MASPKRVLVTGAAGQIGYALLPRIARHARNPLCAALRVRVCACVRVRGVYARTPRPAFLPFALTRVRCG